MRPNLPPTLDELRRRLINVIIALSMLASFILLAFREQLLTVFFGMHREQIDFGSGAIESRRLVAYGLLLAFVPIAVLLLRYLRGELNFKGRSLDVEYSPRKVADATEIESDVTELQERISNVENRLGTLAAEAIGISETETIALIENVTRAAISRVESQVPENLALRLAAQSEREKVLLMIRGVISEARKRLSLELAALSRRGNLNLVIGTLTTIVAVALLYQTVVSATPTPADMTSLLSFYVPRVSTAVFVEVFSFFFLRLYRTGLSDMKYYHSELLTLDLRITALESALMVADTNMLSLVVGKLAETDRTKSGNSSQGSKSDATIDPKTIGSLVEAVLKAAKSEAKPAT